MYIVAITRLYVNIRSEINRFRVSRQVWLARANDGTMLFTQLTHDTLPQTLVMLFRLNKALLKVNKNRYSQFHIVCKGFLVGSLCY